MPSRLRKVTFVTDQEYFWIVDDICHERIFFLRFAFHSRTENTLGFISRANCCCAGCIASITAPKSTDPIIRRSMSLARFSAARATEPNIKATSICSENGESAANESNEAARDCVHAKPRLHSAAEAIDHRSSPVSFCSNLANPPTMR